MLGYLFGALLSASVAMRAFGIAVLAVVVSHVLKPKPYRRGGKDPLLKLTRKTSAVTYQKSRSGFIGFRGIASVSYKLAFRLQFGVPLSLAALGLLELLKNLVCNMPETRCSP